MKLIYLAHPFGGSEGDTGSLFCACDGDTSKCTFPSPALAEDTRHEPG